MPPQAEGAGTADDTAMSDDDFASQLDVLAERKRQVLGAPGPAQAQRSTAR